MRVLRPTDPREAQSLVDRLPHAVLAGGATWLQLDWQAGQPKPDTLIALDRVAGLDRIEEDDGALTLGAGVCLHTLETAPAVAARTPLLQAAVRAIGAPAVRTAGTLGGNIQRGNGDTLPALLVLGARLAFADGGVETLTLPPRPRMVLTRVAIPQPPPTEWIFEKVAGRAAFAVSKLVVAAGLWRDSPDGPVKTARLAAGAADIPARTLPEAARLIEAAGDPKAVDPDRFRTAVGEALALPDTLPDRAWREDIAGRLLTGHLKIGGRKPGEAAYA